MDNLVYILGIIMNPVFGLVLLFLAPIVVALIGYLSTPTIKRLSYRKHGWNCYYKTGNGETFLGRLVFFDNLEYKEAVKLARKKFSKIKKSQLVVE